MHRSIRYNRNRFATLLGLLAVTLLAVGCDHLVSPDRNDPGVPSFSHGVAKRSLVNGLGVLGTGSATPRSDRQDFEFDVAEEEFTGLTGRLFVRDWRYVRSDGSVGSLTVDPAVDGATGISSFTQTSAACVTFDGTGRLDTGQLVRFSVEACDNGSPGGGVDSFAIAIPDHAYATSGTLREGEITRTGDLDVITETTGDDVDPDGYTATVDGDSSKPVGLESDEVGRMVVRFHGLAPGSHTVELSGVAGNCSVNGGNSRTVTITAGSVTAIMFEVSCTATGLATRVTGEGAIGTGSATPGDDRQEFDFDVTSAPAGRLVVRDYTYVRRDGSVASLTADPTRDAATGIQSFSRISAACARFGGMGRVDTGELVEFSAQACDKGTAGAPPPGDLFLLDVPYFKYHKWGTLTEGEITLSYAETTAATGLLFTVQPSNTLPSFTIDPPVQVTAVDAQGSVVTSFTGLVTIAIGRNGGLLAPGTLSGTKVVSALAGTATFSDLVIDQPGAGYTLVVTAPGLPGAESASFDVLTPVSLP